VGGSNPALNHFLGEGMGVAEQEIARIEEQIVTLFKNDERLEKSIAKLGDDITEIKEQLANRLPLWATTLIGILTGICGFLAARAF
jgi:septal ring factor EnvC (AmiA/AmiB activator)